jgi:hypothetical protein
VTAVSIQESDSKPKDNWFLQADRWLSERVGLYGALRRCQSQHWWSATTEFAITLVFAVLPLAVPFVALPMFGIDINPLIDTYWNQIKNGELYLLSTALLAPLYYFTFPKSRNGSVPVVVFPSQQILILIFIVTISIAVLAIAATKVRSDGTDIPDGMILFSQYLFAFCCVTFFLTLAVKHSLPDVAGQIYDDESRREQAEIPPSDPVPDSPPVDEDEFVRQTLEAGAARARA